MYSSDTSRPNGVSPDFDQGIPSYFDTSLRNYLQPTVTAQAADEDEVQKIRSSHLEAVHPIGVNSLSLWSTTQSEVGEDSGKTTVKSGSQQ